MADPACVYVISDDTGACKVGISGSPRRRLRDLQSASSKRLRLIQTIPVMGDCAGAVERYAHWLLREAHIAGEWFRVTPDAALVAVVAAHEAIARGETIPFRIAGPGRPALKVELTSVRLAEGAKDRIAALVGTYGMAKFIREAVDAAIERAEAKQAKAAPTSSPPET